MADCGQCKIPRLCFVHSCNQSSRRMRPTGALRIRLKQLKRLLAQHAIDAKKTLRIPRSAFELCGDALLHFNEVRFARADHPLRIDKTVHVNGDSAAVHEREVRVPDQPDMSCSVALNEKLFRMPPETEHLAVTRHEFILVYRRRLIRARHVCLARARTHTRFSPVYVLSMAPNVRLST